MPVLDEKAWNALRDVVRSAMADHAPAWTTQNDPDPGITLLEACAFLAEALGERWQAAPERAHPLLVRLDDALRGLEKNDGVSVRVNGERWQAVDDLSTAPADAPVFSVDRSGGAIRFGDGEHGRRPPDGSQIVASFRQGGGAEGSGSITVRATWPFDERLPAIARAVDATLRPGREAAGPVSWSGLKRPRYFAGQLLSADDFRAGQEYATQKLRRHQAASHGAGIVSGLDVEIEADRASLHITAGVALDRNGCELIVAGGGRLDLPPAAAPLYVVVEYAERETDPVPSRTDAGTEATRIEEGCRPCLVADPGGSTGAAIARLVPRAGRWAIDPSYKPPRAK